MKAFLILLPFTALVYGYTNWRTDQVMRAFDVYFDWEMRLPLVAGMVYPYVLIFGFVLTPLFVLGAQEMRLLQKRLFIGVLVGLAFFYIFPAPLGFLRPHDPQGLLGVVYGLDRPNNASFSMYHFYLAMIALNLFSHLKPYLKVALVVSVMLMGVSGLLIWQQHVVGIVSAWVSAVVVFIGIRDNADPAETSRDPQP